MPATDVLPFSLDSIDRCARRGERCSVLAPSWNGMWSRPSARAFPFIKVGKRSVPINAKIAESLAVICRLVRERILIYVPPLVLL